MAEQVGENHKDFQKQMKMDSIFTVIWANIVGTHFVIAHKRNKHNTATPKSAPKTAFLKGILFESLHIMSSTTLQYSLKLL